MYIIHIYSTNSKNYIIIVSIKVFVTSCFKGINNITFIFKGNVDLKCKLLYKVAPLSH